jgi:hypothetical protein
MISLKAAKKLRKDLPRGSARLIQQRLQLQGRRFCLSHINKVLDPEDDRYNKIIINEAISLSRELKEQMLSTEEQIFNNGN